MFKKFKKIQSAQYLISFLFLAAIVSFIVFLISSGSGNSKYQAVIDSCNKVSSNEYVSCLNGAIQHFTSQNPILTGTMLTYAYKNVDKSRKIDLRELSDTAHYAGMDLSDTDINLEAALKVCGDSFDGACMHGFVMDRLDDSELPQAQMVKSFLSYCNPVKSNTQYYQNCVHGIGHELWAKINLPLNDSLALCDGFPAGDDQAACQSGEFMEYSKGATTRGHHTHTPAGKITLPCSTLDQKYLAECIDSEASYRQYVPGWESVATTQKYCQSVAKQYQTGCFNALSYRLTLASGTAAY